ncbi:MAG: glucose 1-dehydrogenase [Bauldia sp.]|nr:MAG: glucose 1-dehydrogenase [Bauldia sp.]
MSLFDLSGRVALVTGGNGGIGLGMAEGMAGAGATVMLAGRNAKKAEAALAKLRQAGATADFASADVTDEAACRALVARTTERFGRLDILVNNAGTTVRKVPEQLSVAEWRMVIETNLTSAFVLSQAAHPAMVKAGGGKIINIGSMLSIFGTAYASAYAASKGGIVQFTKSCATAWAKDNIQVNAILPGWIDTDLTQGARREVPGLNERVLARTPAGRWGIPGDFAGIAAFLASKASDFVTGTAIPVDGGFSVQG